MKNFFITETLSWPKDGSGQMSLASNMKMDTSWRLRNILKQSALCSYVDLTHRNVGQVTSKIYYEQSLSFLTTIRSELLKEIGLLESTTMSDEQDFSQALFTVPSTRFDSNTRSSVLKVAKFLLTGEALLNIADLESIKFFNFGHEQVNNFVYALVNNVYNYRKIQTTEGYVIPTLSLPIALPLLHRGGYSIDFQFAINPDYPCVYTQDVVKHSANTIFDFLSNVNIPNGTSDMYLGFIGSCSLSRLPVGNSGPAIKLVCELSKLNSGVPLMRRIKDLLNANPYAIGQNEFNDSNVCLTLLNFLGALHQKHSLVIGPRTNMLLNYIAQQQKSERVVEFIQLILGQSPAVNKSVGVEGLAKLNPESIEFNLPSNVTIGLEAAEEDTPPDDVEVEPAPEEEEPPPAEEPDNVDPDTPDDTDIPNEPSDGDVEPNVEDEEVNEKPTVHIKVPKGSYLFKIRESDKTSVDEYLYLLEVSNIIHRILQDPPDTLKDTHRTILTKLVREWMWQMDVKSVESFLSSVLKTFPKTES